MATATIQSELELLEAISPTLVEDEYDGIFLEGVRAALLFAGGGGMPPVTAFSRRRGEPKRTS